jgi:acyl carrier protein
MDKHVDVIKMFKDAAYEVSGRTLDNLSAQTVLAELQLDSVLVLEIVSHVETNLEMRFDDDQLSHITTLGDLQALVDKTRAAA